MPIQNETELYEPVKRFFEQLGYEVKSEIKSCDLVALRGDEEPLLVELKRTFNLPLVIQGIDRLQRSERVYLAVEQNRTGKAPYGLKWSELIRLCRMLGLGLLVVRFYKTKAPVVEALCDPGPYALAKKRRHTVSLVQEFRERSGDYNTGGSTKVKLVTAYREKALLCAHYLSLEGPLSTRTLRQLTGNPKVTALLRNNHYLWFRRSSRGVYELAPPGVKALADYAALLAAILAKRAAVAAAVTAAQVAAGAGSEATSDASVAASKRKRSDGAKQGAVGAVSEATSDASVAASKRKRSDGAKQGAVGAAGEATSDASVAASKRKRSYGAKQGAVGAVSGTSMADAPKSRTKRSKSAAIPAPVGVQPDTIAETPMPTARQGRSKP
jgi:hypothetical protein